MTTDPFTEAARKQARWEWDFNLSPMSPTPVEDLGQRMAEWARAHLATQEPTEAETEASARVIDPHSWSVYDRVVKWERETGNHAPPYPMAELVEPSMRTARAALSARAARRDEEKR